MTQSRCRNGAWPVVSAVTGIFLLVAGLPCVGEVAMDPGIGFLQMAVETGEHGTEGSPYPWSRFRPGPGHHVLNEHGDDQGDGLPSIAIDADGNPVVTWADALEDGTHRIVVARWDGNDWSDPEPVTDGTMDTSDPAVDVSPSGLLAVAWWEPETGTLAWVRRKQPGGTWEEPESVGSGAGTRRFPAVAATGNDVFVAFSLETPAGTFEVRVARRTEGWDERTIDTGLTESRWRGRGDVAVEIHEQGGRVWIDWLRSADELATSRLDPSTGEWSPAESIPCEPSADGWRRARFEARQRALR